jgi:hypothetical protein
MRTAPLITPPPSEGAAVAPAAPSVSHASLAMPVPTMPMDREFILRNQIAERYISGRLPLRGAQEFERYCLAHPELIDEIGLPERVHAGLRLLEAGGVALPWDEKPQSWWQKPTALIAVAGVAILALIFAAVMGGRLSARDTTIKQLQSHVAEQPVDPATSTRTVKLMPSRTAPSQHPAVTLGGGPAQMADLKIDMSWSKFTAFRVTIDRQDQGRVAVLNYMLRDSNGDLRLALNDSALGPGIYQFAIEGLTLRGENEAQAWITVAVAH